MLFAAIGRGPDRCIDAVGCEAHASSSLTALMDKAKEEVRLQGDRDKKDG